MALFEQILRRSLCFAPLFLIAILSAGCENIWGWTVDENSFEALMSDGRKALRSENYPLAEAKFAAAVDLRPENCDARYYLAKAAVLNADIDVYFIVQTMTEEPKSGAVEIFSYDIPSANAIFRANSVVLENLEPIRRGLAFEGNRRNVDLDLVVAYLLRAILRLRDTNGDGFIDENDLPISEFLLGLLDGRFTLEGLQNLTPEQLNSMILEVASLLLEGGDILTDVFDDSGIDVTALQELNASLQSDMAAYHVNNGIPGNPGEGDNDGDGSVDEECFNGVDDDGDGRTDEDTRLWGC
jgi:hypothetical protein